jgi:hypothetical protein
VEYIIGAGLGVFIPLFAAGVGLGRDRAFYPTVLIVIASYYLLFAAMGGSPRAAFVEMAAMTVFVAVAVIGFRLGLWWVVLGLFAHGVFDFVHGGLIANPGVPSWWPGFCLSIDGVLSLGLARLLRRRADLSDARVAA